MNAIRSPYVRRSTAAPHGWTIGVTVRTPPHRVLLVPGWDGLCGCTRCGWRLGVFPMVWLFSAAPLPRATRGPGNGMQTESGGMDADVPPQTQLTVATGDEGPSGVNVAAELTGARLFQTEKGPLGLLQSLTSAADRRLRNAVDTAQ